MPDVPDPRASTAAAIGANAGGLGDLLSLAGKVNAFNLGQVRAPYLTGIPGYDSLLGQRANIIASEQAGQIPGDVINLLGQQGAERGIGRGFTPGAPNTNAAYMKALGLTSLGQIAKGQQDFTSMIGSTPTAPLFNLDQFMVHPDDIQSAQYQANVLKAAPDPAKQAEEMMKLFRQEQGRNRLSGATGPITVNRGLGGYNPFSMAPAYTPGMDQGVYRAFPENIGSTVAPPYTPSPGILNFENQYWNLGDNYTPSQGIMDFENQYWNQGMDQPWDPGLGTGSLGYPDLETDLGIPSLWQGFDDLGG